MLVEGIVTAILGILAFIALDMPSRLILRDTGMYWSYPVSWLLTFLIHLIYLERDRRRLMVENTAAR